MAEPNTDYEQACDDYKELLADYERAVADGRANAKEVLDRADVAWRALVAAAPPGSPEAGATLGAHRLVAMCYAIAANNDLEAARLYREMTDDERRDADAAEARDPGSVKIWLRRPATP